MRGITEKNDKQNGILDQEWVDLILEALEVGMNVEDIRKFLAEKGNSLLTK